jgi:hypothetical protein
VPVRVLVRGAVRILLQAFNRTALRPCVGSGILRADTSHRFVHSRPHHLPRSFFGARHRRPLPGHSDLLSAPSVHASPGSDSRGPCRSFPLPADIQLPYPHHLPNTRLLRLGISLPHPRVALSLSLFQLLFAYFLLLLQSSHHLLVPSPPPVCVCVFVFALTHFRRPRRGYSTPHPNSPCRGRQVLALHLLPSRGPPRPQQRRPPRRSSSRPFPLRRRSALRRCLPPGQELVQYIYFTSWFIPRNKKMYQQSICAAGLQPVHFNAAEERLPMNSAALSHSSDPNLQATGSVRVYPPNPLTSPTPPSLP